MREKKRIIFVGIVLFILYLGIYYWESIAKLAGNVIGAAKPLLLGCILAYIVNILMEFYEKKGMGRLKFAGKRNGKRILSALLAYVSILLILCGIFYLILPELIACIRTLLEEIPGVLKMLEQNRLVKELLPNAVLNVDVQKKLIEMAEELAGKLTGYMGTAVNLVSSVASLIVSIFVALIFSIYLLFGKEKIARQFDDLASLCLKETWIGKIHYVLGVLNSSFHKFIVGQSVEAVILGSLCILGMALLRLPYAVMIGTFLGFTALIPIAGAYIGASVGAIMILTVSPVKSLVFLLFVVVLQQVEGNLIYPKVVGASIGLPGIWVFAAITIGGGVLGIPGMLLGVPVSAAIYQILKDLQKKKEIQETKEIAEGQMNGKETGEGK